MFYIMDFGYNGNYCKYICNKQDKKVSLWKTLFMTNKRAILRKSLPDMISDDIHEHTPKGELFDGDTIR